MKQILTQRQEIILKRLEKSANLSISEIGKLFDGVTKVTINRDLKKLIEIGYLEKQGVVRSTVYRLSARYSLLRKIDVEKYFQKEGDHREAKTRFDFKVFELLHDILDSQEILKLNGLNNIYQERIKITPVNLQQQEFERLIIELSWKSSQIEGNTYSLLETEALIKHQTEAPGHKKTEATMILNHKRALEYIKQNKQQFLKISVAKLEEIHSLLTNDLDIPRNLRTTAVGIIGTKYQPLDNQHQILEAVEQACVLVNHEPNPFAKAIIISLLIAYIQPFKDGNKRTSRLIANAVLLAYNCCPLSYRNVSEVEYKKAVILFYEQNNLVYFKQLFIEQFEFAVNNYFNFKN